RRNLLEIVHLWDGRRLRATLFLRNERFQESPAMANGQLRRGIMRLWRRVQASEGTVQTDGQLLTAFISHHDERPFEVVSQRHGPMVLSACRRVLADVHAAEDAFQATFLVLALKAPSVADRELVGHWLFRVAYHTALRARAKLHRQDALHQRVSAM